jgi:3-methyladenine DNA glycosylase/8-oxoguanine DNA glycosylase
VDAPNATAPSAPARERTFRVPFEVDLLTSLRPLVSSAQDPTIRLRADAVARSLRSPDGPACIEVRRVGERYTARAWGPGAAWALEHAPGLVGAHDRRRGFVAHDPLVARAARARPGLRLVRSGLVWDLLVPTILAQRVTGGEAARSWTRIVRAWGERAPGPHGLLLSPSPERLATTPYWAFHRYGVERARAVAIIEAARRADRLQEAVELPHDDAAARICAVAGLGPWTAALVLRVAAGDPDHVEVGDFHVKHQITWALAGEPRGTDARMLDLLERYRGHRGRVVRLLGSTGVRAPAYGARKRVIPVHQL